MKWFTVYLARFVLQLTSRWRCEVQSSLSRSVSILGDEVSPVADSGENLHVHIPR